MAQVDSQNRPKRGSQTELDFRPIFEVPLGKPEIKVIPPRDANGPVCGPGGRLQRGVPRLRTSEFWIPDLGDLEAMDLDTLEYYRLVAKSPPLNSLVAPKGPADL